MPVRQYGGVAKITLSVDDGPYGKGVAHTYYRVDGGTQAEGTTVSVPGPASGIETKTVEFWSVDKAGNIEEAHAITFTITTDTIAPTTTSDALGAYIGGGTIRLTPTDPAPSSDVAHTYYRLDDGPQTEGTSLSLYTGGSHTLVFWSVDNAGNAETANTVTFDIVADLQAPVTTSDRGTVMPIQPWINLTAIDPGGSGVAATYHRIDSDPVNDYPRFVIYGLRGWHTLEFWSVDNAGNEESHTVMPIYIDWERPVSTSDAKPSYEGSATITLSATDDYAVDKIFWRLETGTQQTGTTVRAWKSGTHKLWFWARDAVGHEEAPYNSVEFTIVNGDDTAPTSTVDVANGVYIGPPRTVHLTAADQPDGSGVAATYYTIRTSAGYGPTVKVDAPVDITIDTPGRNTIYYWSEDLAGNTEYSKSATVSIIQ